MQIQAAIFDMDGLLLDTEKLCMAVFEQACHAQALPFYPDVYLSIIGQNSKSINQVFSRVYGEDLERLHEEWRGRYDAIVQKQAIDKKDGVIALLEWLKQSGIKLAVATSTRHEVAVKKLELAGLDKYFEVLATGCEVSNGKPHPEIYQLAAERLGVKEEYCVAFEDSNNGVKACIAAGMRSYQIPDLVEPTEDVVALGHYIFPSLNDALDDLKALCA